MASTISTLDMAPSVGTPVGQAEPRATPSRAGDRRRRPASARPADTLDRMPDPSGESLPHLRWSAQPDLPDGPVLIAAFGGWNDAGDAATTAIDHLAEQWGARTFADIDPEDFFDFTSTRPEVRIDLDGRRRIDWPANVFQAATTPEGLGVVTLSGVEPQLRWRTFCDHVLVLAEGRLAAAGPPADVLTPDVIQAVYHVQADVLEHPRTGRPVIAFSGTA